MDKNMVTVSISRDLYFEVERIVNASSGKFKTVENYVEFVLRKATREDEKEKQNLKPEEKEQIKRRLRSLGYL